MLALVVIFGCEYEMVWFPLIFAHGSLLSFLMVFMKVLLFIKYVKKIIDYIKDMIKFSTDCSIICIIILYFFCDLIFCAIAL